MRRARSDVALECLEHGIALRLVKMLAGDRRLAFAHDVEHTQFERIDTEVGRDHIDVLLQAKNT